MLLTVLLLVVYMAASRDVALLLCLRWNVMAVVGAAARLIDFTTPSRVSRYDPAGPFMWQKYHRQTVQQSQALMFFADVCLCVAAKNTTQSNDWRHLIFQTFSVSFFSFSLFFLFFLNITLYGECFIFLIVVAVE